jgi:hypothetical protein
MVTRNVEISLEECVMYVWLKNIVSFLDDEDIVISLHGFVWNSLCLLLCRALPTPTEAVWVFWYLPVRADRPMCVSLYSGCNRGMTGMLLNELFTKYYEVFFLIWTSDMRCTAKRGRGGALIGYLARILRADMTLPIGTSAFTVF